MFLLLIGPRLDLFSEGTRDDVDVLRGFARRKNTQDLTSYLQVYTDNLTT